MILVNNSEEIKKDKSEGRTVTNNNLFLGDGVERGGCLIQNNRVWPLENETSNGDALLLSTRQRQAAFAYICI